MTDLARVTDPAALDGESRTSGRIALDVLPSWLDAREVISFVVPRRVSCARCDGGGCDLCERSGAFRIEGGDAERTLQLTLPGEPAVVRIPQPFAGAPEILLVELRAAGAPSPQSQVIPRARGRWWLVAVLVVIVVAALLYSSCHAPSA